MWSLLIFAAGVLHLGIAAGNLLLPHALDYPRHLPAMDPLMRQVYLVHSLYIIVVLAFLGLVCLAFPAELAGGTPLGRTLSAGLALFWGLRLGLQACYFDLSPARHLRWLAMGFTAVVVFFVGLFAALAAGLAPAGGLTR